MAQELEERVSSVEKALEKFIYHTNHSFLRLHDLVLEMRQDAVEFKQEMRAFKDEMLAFKDEMRAFKDEMLAFKDEMLAFKQEMLAFKDEMRAFKDEMLAFKDEMRDFKDEMLAFKDEMRAFKDEMLAFKDEMRAFKDEMLAFKDEMRAFKDEMLAFKDEMRAFKDEMLAFKDEMLAFKDEMLAFKDEMRAFKDEMLAFKDEMRDFKDETERFRDTSAKRWGELANRLGTLAEDMVIPNLPQVAEKYFGCPDKPDDFMVRRKKKLPGSKDKQKEIDGIVIYPGIIIINETRTSPRDSDIQGYAGFIEEFFDYYPEYQGKKLIPVFSSLYLNQGHINLLTKNGIYAMALKGDTMDLLNYAQLKQGSS